MEAVLGAVAARAAGRGPRRERRAWGAPDVGHLGVALSASACITALTAPVYTPAVVGAVLAGGVTLSVGVWVSMYGHGRHVVGFVNLCCALLALVVAIAQGGEFDPELLLKLYHGFAG